MTLETRRIDQMGAGVAILLVAAFAVLTWVSGITPLREAAYAEHTLEQAVAILHDAEAGLSGLDDEIADVSAALAASEAALPASLDLEGFLAYVQTLAAGNAVRIETLTPGAGHDRALYHERRVTMRLVGHFLDVYRFLRALEDGQRLALVDHLNLVGSPSTSECAADLEIVLYTSPEGPTS